MFLTRPSVSLVFPVSETPLKPLNRISWSFVDVKNIHVPCRCAYPQEILIPFFSQNYALFELRNLIKIKDTNETVCQRNSSETVHRISWNVVVMKDIMCSYAYPQEIVIHFFFIGITPFLNFEIWPKWKLLLKQFVSATWNFAVIKELMCRYAFLQEMLIWSF